MDFSHDSWENGALFMIIGARVLDLWQDKSCGSNWPKCSFYAPGLKFKKYFQISWFYWISLIILEKMRSWLWILEPGLWTYGWVHLVGSIIGLNVVSRTQDSCSTNFLWFHDLIGFVSYFSRKWGPTCEYWSQGSGLLAGYVLWAQLAQM